MDQRQKEFGKSLGSSLVGCNACGEAFRENFLWAVRITAVKFMDGKTDHCSIGKARQISYIALVFAVDMATKLVAEGTAAPF
jgi:hypothetical protein